MGPRPRQDILELLARAVKQAEHAEAYHAAAADPGALRGQAAHQAARDAAAMQLIELAGCGEGFTRERGEPRSTLAGLDDALRPLFRTRTGAHTPRDRRDAAGAGHAAQPGGDDRADQDGDRQS